MTRAKTAGTALDRVRGPTSESAHLANAILEAESTLNGTARDMALKVNNQTLEESYFRSWKSMEKQGQAYRLDLLTKMYKKAKKKSLDCSDAGGGSALPLKIHTQQGARVYAAIATLLYASIGSTKVDDLEAFIRRKGVTLPGSIFDLDRWIDVLDVARVVRSNNDSAWSHANLGGTNGFIPITHTPDSPAEAEAKAKANTGQADPFSATGDLMTGEALEEEDDYELEFEPEHAEKGKGRGIAATVVKNNNWVNSPVKEEGRKTLRRKAQSLVKSHSTATESIEKELSTMAAMMNSAKQSLARRLEEHLSAENDRVQVQSMRIEQLELELERTEKEKAQGYADSEPSSKHMASGPNISPATLKELQNKLQESDQELARQRELATELAAKLSATEASLGAVTEELVVARERNANNHEVAIDDLRKQNEALENSVRGMHKTLKHCTAEKDGAVKQVQELQQALSQLQTESRDKEQALKDVQERMRQAAEAFAKKALDEKQQQDRHGSALSAAQDELLRGQERLAVEERHLGRLQRELWDAQSRENRLSTLICSTEDPNLMHLMEMAKQKHHAHHLDEGSGEGLKDSASPNSNSVLPGEHHHHHRKHHHEKVAERSPVRRLAHSLITRVIGDAAFAAALAGTSSKLRSAALGGLPGGASGEGFASAEELTKALDAELTKSTSRLSSLTAELKERDAEVIRLREAIAKGSDKAQQSEGKFIEAQVESARLQKELSRVQFESRTKDETIDGIRLEKAGLSDQVASLGQTLASTQRELTAAKEELARAVETQAHHVIPADNHHLTDSRPKSEGDIAKHRAHDARAMAHVLLEEGYNKAMIKSISGRHVAERERLQKQLVDMSSMYHRLKEEYGAGASNKALHGKHTPAPATVDGAGESGEKRAENDRLAVEAVVDAAKEQVRRQMEGLMDDLRRQIRSLESAVSEGKAALKKTSVDLSKANAILKKTESRVSELQQDNAAFKERIEELQAADNLDNGKHLTNLSSPADFTSILEENEVDNDNCADDITEEDANDHSAKAAEFANNANALVNDFAAKKGRMSRPLLNRKLSRGDSVITNRDRSAKHIQRMIRGWLARVLVGHLITEKAAAHQGILVAYRGSGTRQGEAGWYISNQQLFYFALDKGEFVLVCGPMSEEEYDQALNECLDKGLAPRPSSVGDIEIDRLGLVALRVEISRYKRRIEAMNNDLGPNGALQGVIGDLRTQIASKERENVNLHRTVDEKNMDIQRHKGLIQRQEQLTEDARKAMYAAKTELTTLHDRIRLLEGTAAGFSGSDPTTPSKPGAGGSPISAHGSPHRRLMLHRGGMSTAEISAKFAALPITAKTTKSIICLQAHVRGFIKRSQDRMAKDFSSASASGVLVALKGTVQGKSGWYRTPDNRVYYFTLSHEDWIVTAGPMSLSTYQDLVYGPLPLPGAPDSPHRLTDGDGGADTPKVPRSKRRSLMKRKKFNEIYQAGNLLVKANCEMQVVHPDLAGDLFMDRSTKHLFFAVNLEQMVRSSHVSS